MLYLSLSSMTLILTVLLFGTCLTIYLSWKVNFLILNILSGLVGNLRTLQCIINCYVLLYVSSSDYHSRCWFYLLSIVIKTAAFDNCLIASIAITQKFFQKSKYKLLCNEKKWRACDARLCEWPIINYTHFQIVLHCISARFSQSRTASKNNFDDIRPWSEGYTRVEILQLFGEGRTSYRYVLPMRKDTGREIYVQLGIRGSHGRHPAVR